VLEAALAAMAAATSKAPTERKLGPVRTGALRFRSMGNDGKGKGKGGTSKGKGSAGRSKSKGKRAAATTDEKETPRGSPKKLLFWLLVTVGGVAIGYYVQKWLKENDEHHVARFTIHRAVEKSGTLLLTSDRTLTIDPVPPVGTHRVANVLIGDSNCKPSGTLTVDVAKNVQVALGACDLPSGTTGELVWTDSQTSSVGVDD
jgi:hypothetical protein